MQLYELIEKAIQNNNKTFYVCEIARVTKVNGKTINCQPVIARLNQKNETVLMPEFIEVPPIFMQGGQSYTMHPISIGDYCLLFITNVCFDTWYAGQDGELHLENRHHDLSDSFAIVGVNPLNKALTIPRVIRVNGDVHHTGNVLHDGNYVLNGNMTINGNLQVNGDINCSQNGVFQIGVAAGNFTGLNGADMTSSTNIRTTEDVSAGSISLKNHTHPQSGGGNTGAPNS